MPPGIQITLELWRSKDEIAVDGFPFGNPANQPDARIVIEHAHLHVPIGTLDMSLFNEYEASLRRSVARIRFRRWTVRTEAIPLQTQNYESTILFNPTDFPCRIIVGYMTTERFNGKYDKSYFK